MTDLNGNIADLLASKKFQIRKEEPTEDPRISLFHALKPDASKFGIRLLTNTPPNVKKIQREIKILQTSKVKTLSPVIQVETDDEYIYIHQKCYKTLRNGFNVSIKNGKSVSEGFVLNLLTDILCALYDLHARHVVHGNVDMDCIMVDGTSKFLLGGLENSRISSFGRLRNSENVKPSHAPEQVAASATVMEGDFEEDVKELGALGYTHLVDIWALGVVTYELISREHPFKKYTNKDELVDRIMKESLTLPKKKGFSSAFYKACGRMLSKAVDSRPEAAQLLAGPLFRNLDRQNPVRDMMDWEKQELDLRSG